MFRRHKLRAVFRGSRRSWAVWNYNKSKDRSRTRTKKRSVKQMNPERALPFPKTLFHVFLILVWPICLQVKWIHMLYHDFSAFSRDQEHLISINGLDYLEGSLFLHNCPPNNWRSSFSPSDYPRISSLISKKGIIYCLEVVKYYDDLTSHTVDEVRTYILS